MSAMTLTHISWSQRSSSSISKINVGFVWWHVLWFWDLEVCWSNHFYSKLTFYVEIHLSPNVKVRSHIDIVRLKWQAVAYLRAIKHTSIYIHHTFLTYLQEVWGKWTQPNTPRIWHHQSQPSPREWHISLRSTLPRLLVVQVYISTNRPLLSDFFFFVKHSSLFLCCWYCCVIYNCWSTI